MYYTMSFKYRIQFIGLVLILSTTILIISYNKLLKDFKTKLIFSSLTSPNDPNLIKYIRNELTLKPSNKPYNLLGFKNAARMKIEASELFYSRINDILFKNKTNGFFVEAGALDGETMSNTLKLEMKNGWSGVLVEPDPISFKNLVRKNRKAWMINACISQKKYPTQEVFVMGPTYSTYVNHQLERVQYGLKTRSMNRLKNNVTFDHTIHLNYFMVKCVPLESILTALKVHKVDLLSLDLEGNDVKVLENFPFNKFDIQVIYIECINKANMIKLENLMLSKDYFYYARGGYDHIYIKIGSEYANDPDVFTEFV